MGNNTIERELIEIEDCLSRHPEGIGISGLVEELAARGLVLLHRTLQRRVSLLQSRGRVAFAGNKKGRLYLPFIPYAAILAADLKGASSVSEATLETYLPMSAEAREIREYVRQPRQQRIPVGYRQDFLESYVPNRSCYLSVELREQLRLIGTPAEVERPAGTFARDVMNRLLIDLSWASSHLEGNTYSRLDTERLIEFGQVAQGKDALETQMILNHKAAVEFLVNEAETVDFTPETIKNLHALLSDGLLHDGSACGRIRHRPVEIGGSVYRPIALPQRLEELFQIILEMAREITDPFEQAFFAMVHVPYLQPFEDVNKRVSRLAANIPLIGHNLCPLSFIDVPEAAYVEATLGVYELNRVELLRDVFVWAYERSCQQYLAVRQDLVPPDTFRLRYRNALSQTVRDIILKRRTPTRKVVMASIPSSVPRTDRADFLNLVLKEFETLHEGNAIRFGIRPFEYAAWRDRSDGA